MRAWFAGFVCMAFGHRYEPHRKFDGEHRFHMIYRCARCGDEQ